MITPSNQTNRKPSRIRTGLLVAAIAGGTVLGATQLGGIANAQTDTTTDTATDTATDTTTDDAADHAERREARHAEREANRQELADLLGVDTDTLAEWLHGGGTLAQIAEENGVDQQAVVDLIVGQMTDRLDMAVENGRIDEAEAAEKAADLVERVTTRVTEGRPEGAGEGRGHRGGGHGPRGGGADADGGASDGDAPVTTEG